MLIITFGKLVNCLPQTGVSTVIGCVMRGGKKPLSVEKEWHLSNATISHTKTHTQKDTHLYFFELPPFPLLYLPTMI